MPQKTLITMHEALSSYYTNIRITIIKTEQEISELIKRAPDLVISGIKYLGFDHDSIERNSKRKIWFTDILDKYGIKYTGSSRNALELEFDKSEAKKKIQEHGLVTAPFFVTDSDKHKSLEMPLEYPLFIKPLFEGDSRGIDLKSLAYTFQEYQEKVASIFRNQNTVSLVEKFLSGKEYTVAIIEDFRKNNFQIYPIELLAEENKKNIRILGYDDKIADKELALLISDPEIKKIVSSLALNSFKALGAKGYGRIDIKMDGNGIPNFIEANLIPGFGFGYFYRCYKLNGGISHRQMIIDIAKNSFDAFD